MIERTLILVKHDGVVRGLIGEILKRFEHIGLKIVGLKMVKATDHIAGNHYVVTEEWANALAEKTKKSYAEKGIEMKETPKQIADRVQRMNKIFLQEGPIVAIVLEGPHAVDLGRKIVGSTEPRQALPGTIRGDFSLDSYAVSDKKKRSVRNLVHASGTPAEADREIALWFTQQELYSYTGLHDHHLY
ncbi:MAG: nucleoside-diphosphate kinase [Candidatus Woesearchaeota archaeon]|nr:nucleoside-diphosphate kinase [Candidatus Woesearchaeota archaeon]